MEDVASLAVIGAGRTGRQIAAYAALAGYRTILEDILPASLKRAESEIRGQLGRSLTRGKPALSQVEAALARLEYTDSVAEAARRAELVIEAVPDEMESKIEIFALLDRIAKPRTILATTTNTLSIAEIASTTYRAKRILGLRFFPSAGEPERLERIEIVRAAGTGDDTVAACAEVGRRMTERVVVVAETPTDL